MNGSPYDPYAPPREDPVPAGARPPGIALPQGIQRYALDRDLYRDRVAQARRARIVRGVVAALLYGAIVVSSTPLKPASLCLIVVIWGATIGASYLVLQARARRLEPHVLRGYEILLSPRVLRRSSSGTGPAEILAPEVSSIVEVPEGLSIVSREPIRRVLVPRALDRFADVRDHVGTWAPIETRSGLRAYLRRLSHLYGATTRDAADGALAHDATLRGELEAVRALAMPFDPRSVRAARRKRIGAGLLLLVVFFLTLWHLLAPARRALPRPHPRLPPDETTVAPVRAPDGPRDLR